MTPLDRHYGPGAFEGAIRRILELQQSDGLIPWYDRGVWDPWNHTHAAMGLSVAGRFDEALRAYDAMAVRQNADGSWWAQYGAAVPFEDNKYKGAGEEPWVRDTNYSAYAVTGVMHHAAVTRDRAILSRHWPMVERSIGFVLSLQSEHGEIRWSAPDPGTPQDDALVTGSSSIFKSLGYAIQMAEVLGHHKPEWRTARARLGEALRGKPERFDRQWEKKDYFAMDWYYPVLAGVYRGAAARARIAARWGEFVAEGQGCLCVLNQPWVTIAEACELVLALLSVGEHGKAKALFEWQRQWRDESGAYWMGVNFAEGRAWPEERPAWTNATVLLAADALAGATPGAGFLLAQHDPF